MSPARSPATSSDVIRNIAAALTTVLADMFALYLKTKNFDWHASGPHFRDYHQVFDEQSEQIFAALDAVAARARKVGGPTLRSIDHVQQLQHVPLRKRQQVRRQTRPSHQPHAIASNRFSVIMVFPLLGAA
jgi:starvation-inducible DNA-binding protein